MHRYLKRSWIGFLIGLAIAGPRLAHAGTYNFYFNNTEQGEGSTASPTVTVQGPAPAASPTPQAESAVEPAGTPEPASANASAGELAAGSSSTRSGYRMLIPGERSAWFRFTIEAGTINGRYRKSAGVFDSDPNSTLPFWEQKHEKSFGRYSGSLGLSVVGRHVGGTLTLGSIPNIELELNPIGRGRDVIEPVAIIGYSTHFSSMDISAATHVGARLMINFGKRVSLTLTGRRSLSTSDSDLSFTQIESGIALHI